MKRMKHVTDETSAKDETDETSATMMDETNET